MGIKVILTESAYLDLEEIDDLISKSSPSFSRKFISSIFDNLDILIDFPKLGKQVTELNNPRIRELLQGKYGIVYYLKTDDEIEVLRIIHGSKLLDLE